MEEAFSPVKITTKVELTPRKLEFGELVPIKNKIEAQTGELKPSQILEVKSAIEKGYSEDDIVRAFKETGEITPKVAEPPVRITRPVETVKTETPMEARNIKADVEAGKADLKTSKIAKSIEQKMKDIGMIDEGVDIEKATFEGITVKEQAEEMAKILQDKQLVDDILSGKKPLSEKVRPSSFIKAIEDDAIRGVPTPEKIKRLERLAKSKIAGETSYSAQDLRMAAERDPDSAVIKMREIAKAREEALQKRLKN